MSAVEGRSRPGRLVLYVAVVLASALAVLYPELGGDQGSGDQSLTTVDEGLLGTDVDATEIEGSSSTSAVDGTSGSPLAASGGSAGSVAPTPDIGTSSAAPPSASDPPATTPGTVFTWPTASTPTAGAPRGVVPPATGAYLGAYLDPFSSNGEASIREVLANLPEFNQRIGRNLAIVSLYQPWSDGWVQIDNLRQIADTQGAIPMVSWRCGDGNDRIISGADDSLIFSFANELVSYGRPVLLRWYWEPNLVRQNRTCLGGGTVDEQASRYRAAFQRVHEIFQAAGATNVAFVWCASTAGVAAPMEDFYPGDEYVDWIAADGYSRRERGRAAIPGVFGPWYDRFASHGKPMMIAETGATTDQVDFLQGLGELLPTTYPQVKALVYFDAVGTIDWRLSSYGGAGLDAFGELGRNPHFAPMPEAP